MVSDIAPDPPSSMLRTSMAMIWTGLVVFILVLYVVLRVSVLRSFLQLESRGTVEDIHRVLDAVAEQARTLNSKASDWAAWDDAYQFVQDRNSRFIQSNVVLSAFTGIDLSLIAYLDTSDRVVYARWYRPGAGGPVPVPANIHQAITREGPLTAHQGVRDSVSGILMLDQGPMLVASRPVVTSHEQGPIRGSLIFGRMLDRGVVQSLVRVTHVSVVIQRLSNGTLTPDFAEARAALSRSGQTAVRRASRRVVAGYTVIDDIHGRPALMLRVQTSRTIYNRGRSVSTFALVSLALLSIFFGSVISLLLAHAVRREREFDLKTREFYRRTIMAATNGKLIMTDRSEILRACASPSDRWRIDQVTDVPEIRDRVLEIAVSAGMEEDRAWDFATAAGEAITNAIKHAGGGEASLCPTPEALMFVTADRGPGIPALTLPHVAIRGGYSTAGTLGMGYKIMISLVDCVRLATGPQGTTVSLEMNIHPKDTSLYGLGSTGFPG